MTVHPADSSPPTPAAVAHGRFAPSPTGPLHMGSLLAALGSWASAHSAGGRWSVRVEDVDRLREIPGAASSQLQALAGFGFRPDGPVLVQSQRDARYREVLDALLARGEAFVCHCSRADLAVDGGRHRGTCRARAPRPDPAVRLRVPAGTCIDFEDEVRGPQQQQVDVEVGDFVLRRADGFWAYQLAVVVDDADLGVTEVVRGADLLDSTARQILLQRVLGLPTPRYSHLPLLLDAEGRKLSKSTSAIALDPADPMPALRFAWAALGQSPIDAGTPEAFLTAAAATFRAGAVPPHDLQTDASGCITVIDRN